VRVRKLRTQTIASARADATSIQRPRQLPNGRKAIVTLHEEDMIASSNRQLHLRCLSTTAIGVGKNVPHTGSCQDDHGIRHTNNYAGPAAGIGSDLPRFPTARRTVKGTAGAENQKKGGRNFHGLVCGRFRAAATSAMYRLIDFKRRKDSCFGRSGRHRVRTPTDRHGIALWSMTTRAYLHSGSSRGP